ncbi:MAG: MFS transporter [Acidimicrobiales bacterium]|nr:MFS transporter [Acidimicrobiales bacterium]
MLAQNWGPGAASERASWEHVLVAPVVDSHPPYRWVLLGGVCAIYFTFGVLVMSIPPLVGEVRADLGLSRSGMGLALGAWQLIYIASSPFCGKLLDRLGVGQGIALGSLVMIASGFLRALAGGLGSFWLAVALFGVGGPLISAGAPKFVGQWFTNKRERRLAIGIYTAMPAVGGTATLVLSNSVLMPLTGSWRTTVVVETALIVLALTAWLVIWSRRPEPPLSTEAEVGGSDRPKTLLASAEFRIILLLGLGIFFVFHGLGGWMPEVLREHSGFSPMAAANWVAVGGLVGVVTSLIVPRRTERRHLATTMACFLALAALAALAVVLLPTSLDPIPVVIGGARTALMPLILVALLESEPVTPRNAGLASGLWFGIAEVGGVAGPLVVGWVADTSMGFSGALVLMATVCVAMIFPVSRLHRFVGRE